MIDTLSDPSQVEGWLKGQSYHLIIMDYILPGLNAEQKTAVQQTAAKLKTATDATKLKAGLAKMDENAAQAPAEMKPVTEVIKKKIEARIAELEAAKK